MFAYCGNNPVNCVDPYGYYTDGQIHDMVLEEISRRSGYKYKYHRKDTLVIYPVAFGLKWFGFCDLYDPDTGETWELKKNSRSSSCRTEYAKKQLQGYINGNLANDPQLDLKYPTTTIPAGYFDRTDPSGTQYWISYWDEGGGILRYQYFEIPSQFDVAAVAIIAGVFISSITVQEGCRAKVEQNYHD